MAEREGFEPSRRYQRLHDFQSCAFDQLSHLSTELDNVDYYKHFVTFRQEEKEKTLENISLILKGQVVPQVAVI